jgi:single-stranded DNA-binding protein
MDTNLVVLTGHLVSATERIVGHQGRSLTELRLAVARPSRKGEGEAPTSLPITIWAPDLGTAVRDLPEGTPLTVIGRLSGREWSSPTGQTRKFVEIVAEHVTGAVAAERGESAARPAEEGLPF